MISREFIIEKRRKAREALERYKAEEIKRRMGDGSHENGDNGHENEDKPEYTGATFLYMRAYDGDTGARPVPSGITYWLSPDIEIYKDGALVDTANPLVPNQNYTLRVTVRNGGDLDCSSCMVDIFITRPSVGFSVDEMLRIGFAGTSVAAHSSTDVDFPFTAAEEMCGHRCMFARVYSLITNDFPADFVYFNTSGDRHIGQQNVNIVRQGETVGFNIVPGKAAANGEFEITLKKHLKGFTKDVAINKKYNILTKKNVSIGDFQLKKIETPAFPGRINDAKRPDIPKIPDTTGKKIIAREDLKDVKRFGRNSWKQQLTDGTNKLNIKVPFLGLQGNEAVPLELTVKDPGTGKAIGGITLLVVK